MSKILTYFGWIFFVYSENERAHLHVYKKEKLRNRSAKVFLEKNGIRELIGVGNIRRLQKRYFSN